MRTEKPILLIEDDRIDVMTVQRAMKELRVTNLLVTVENGEEAIKLLQDPEARPCLILLDLNMPIMNGLEFLRAVRSDKDLRLIPIVVLTTSNEQRDKVETFGLGVAGYMTKIPDYQKFVEVMRAIDTYWTLSEMP
ncbi:MAG: response regulator [Burkholderiales bacterium]|nr:response regulator [Burkholderiales bacterium]